MNNIESKISLVLKQNEKILNELDFVEEILKALTINSLLSDTESLMKLSECTSLKKQELSDKEKADERVEKLKIEIARLKNEYDLLNSRFNYLDNLFMKNVGAGSTAYIKTNATEYFDKNFQCKYFRNYNVLQSHKADWIWTIIGYDHGMYQLKHETKKKTYIIWISVSDVNVY